MTYDNFDIATLYKVAAETRNKVLEYGKFYVIDGRSEIKVRAQLIDPVLRALGWDPANRRKVILEYDTIEGSCGGSNTDKPPQAFTSDAERKRRFVDYALCLNDAKKLSPCAIVEAKQMQSSGVTDNSRKRVVSNFKEKDFTQLFAYYYNIDQNKLAYNGNLIYKVISDGNLWLIYGCEKQTPVSQLICKLQFSDNRMSLDTIIANLSMLSFPAIKSKADSRQYGNPLVTVPLSSHIHRVNSGDKYVAIKIGKSNLQSKTGKATELWNLILNYLLNNGMLKKILNCLPIETTNSKKTRLIIAKSKQNTSTMNRRTNGGKGNNDQYVFKANGDQIVYEASAGTAIILKDIQVVLEKSGIDIDSVFLEIEMDN